MNQILSSNFGSKDHNDICAFFLPFQQRVGRELVPFATSGAHVHQKNYHPSPLEGFVGALLRCNPRVPLAPAVLYYFGKSHNMWHEMALVLEESVLTDPGPEKFATSQLRLADCYDFVEPSVPGNDFCRSSRTI